MTRPAAGTSVAKKTEPLAALAAFTSGGNEMSKHIPDHEELRRDLGAVFGQVEPSDQLRASVLQAADRHLAGRQVRRIPRPLWRRPALATAVAAAAAIVLLLARPDAPVPTGDLNGDGRIDILDAWRLSSDLRTGQGQDQADLDADGEITPDDLDRLLEQIVSVGGGTS